MQMQNVQDNPNGNYFKIRRRIAIGCVIAIAVDFLFVNNALLRHSFDKETVLLFVIYNLCFCGFCALYISIYAILVFSHDVQFEKIAKLGIEAFREIKK